MSYTMKEPPEDPKKASRPPLQDPLAVLIRELRRRRRLSLQALGKLVGASAPHLYNIESGRKLPSEDLAARIARALGLDPEAFRAWVRATGRSDWRTTREATLLLDRFISDPSVAELLAGAGLDLRSLRAGLERPVIARRLSAFPVRLADEREALERRQGMREPDVHASMSAPEIASYDRTDALLAGGREIEPGSVREAEEAEHAFGPARQASRIPTGGPGPARVLVPILEPGRDPDDAPSRGPSLRLDPERLTGAVESLVRPFAYPLGSGLGRRAGDALPTSGFAVLTRAVDWPPRPGGIYAVRRGQGVELGPVMWNGSQLLILPTPGGSDFAVVDAAEEAVRRDILRGRVVLIAT